MRQNLSKRLISFRASEKIVKQKAFSFWGLCPTDPRPGALPLDPAGDRPVAT